MPWSVVFPLQKQRTDQSSLLGSYVEMCMAPFVRHSSFICGKPTQALLDVWCARCGHANYVSGKLVNEWDRYYQVGGLLVLAGFPSEGAGFG